HGDARAGLAARASGRDGAGCRAAASGARAHSPRRLRAAVGAGRSRRDCCALSLGGQALDRPAVALAHVAEPVVEPVLAVLPELVAVGNEAEPSPLRRQRHLRFPELRFEPAESRVELLPRGERLRLVRGERGDLTRPGTGVEVALVLLVASALDTTLDPHLASERFPVE